MTTSTQSTKKTSYDDDESIDFKKLEKELTNAVEDEAKYWRENDAKFRAVHQKVATYDEFRDIVLASHLKPLDKDDRLTDVKFVQPWNSHATKQVENADREQTAEIPKLSNYPTSGPAFIREWRRFNKDTKQQYAYLKELGGERLEEIFKPEIGFGLLGEFGHCLDYEFESEDFDNVTDILSHLCETNRFSLSVTFLSTKEKQGLKSLFGKLRQNIGERDSCILVELEKTYSVKL